MPDQVHLLVEVDPQLGIHTPVKVVKGRLSMSRGGRCVRSRLATLWKNSYFVATVGGAPRSVIKVMWTTRRAGD